MIDIAKIEKNKPKIFSNLTKGLALLVLNCLIRNVFWFIFPEILT